tara:strand:- start:291 stop:905 length:615 start_codon:yes stop_codon:yes gene_type:complete
MPSRTPTLSISEKLKRKKLKEKKEKIKLKRKRKYALLDQLDLDVHGPLIEDYSWDNIVIQKLREDDDFVNDFDKISLQTPVEFETFTCNVSEPTEAMNVVDLLYVFDLFLLEPSATKYKKGETLIIVEDFSKGNYKPGGICIVRKVKENETYDVKMIVAGNIRRNVTLDLLTLPVLDHSTRNSIPTNFLGDLVSTQNKEYLQYY